MWFTCSERHQYVDDDDDKASSKPGSTKALQQAAEAEQHLSALRLVNEELMKANERLLRNNHELQRKLDAVHSDGGSCSSGDGATRGTESKARKQGELLQDMALKRRLSAEVEFAKRRLQVALSHDRQVSGSEQGDGESGGEVREAAGRHGGAGAPGGGARRCFDLESCAAATKQVEGGREGGDWAEEGLGVHDSVGFGWP